MYNIILNKIRKLFYITQSYTNTIMTADWRVESYRYTHI